ncbi:unnamed protein product, partial [Iphiclides podalirius]
MGCQVTALSKSVTPVLIRAKISIRRRTSLASAPVPQTRQPPDELPGRPAAHPNERNANIRTIVHANVFTYSVPIAIFYPLPVPLAIFLVPHSVVPNFNRISLCGCVLQSTCRFDAERFLTLLLCF